MGKIRCGENNRGSTSIANGGTITHNCPSTPIFCEVKYSGSEHIHIDIQWNATTITVRHDGLDVLGVANITVYWVAFYDE